jgi:hypothetical protein
LVIDGIHLIGQNRVNTIVGTVLNSTFVSVFRFASFVSCPLMYSRLLFFRKIFANPTFSCLPSTRWMVAGWNDWYSVKDVVVVCADIVSVPVANKRNNTNLLIIIPNSL